MEDYVSSHKIDNYEGTCPPIEQLIFNFSQRYGHQFSCRSQVPLEHHVQTKLPVLFSTQNVYYPKAPTTTLAL